MSSVDRVVVLGTGMAGLGAVSALRDAGVAPLVFDGASEPGGHTKTFLLGDFIFDEGPHVSFTRSDRIRGLFEEAVGGQFETRTARINNCWRGHWLEHPAQCHLAGLPVDLLVDIIADFARQSDPPGVLDRYDEWLRASYGRTFADTFPMEYNRKYHTTDPSNMTTEWLGPRMYRPTLEELLRGAFGEPVRGVHYVSEFRYPKQGGFVSFLKPLLRAAQPRLEHRLEGVDPIARQLRFGNGSVQDYDVLVSSLPLPELVPRIDGVREQVREATRRLGFTSVVLVSLGIDRPGVSDAHFSYFYDRDVSFARLSFPSNFAGSCAPEGTSSIQAEVYYSGKYRPLQEPLESVADRVVADLRGVGLLRSQDRLLCRDVRLVPYANVIYDLDRADAVRSIHEFLDSRGISYCGRYGRWDHSWTDESFLSGVEAAERALLTAATQV